MHFWKTGKLLSTSLLDAPSSSSSSLSLLLMKQSWRFLGLLNLPDGSTEYIFKKEASWMTCLNFMNVTIWNTVRLWQERGKDCSRSHLPMALGGPNGVLIRSSIQVFGLALIDPDSETQWGLYSLKCFWKHWCFVSEIMYIIHFYHD